jgi:hypothetical protein
LIEWQSAVLSLNGIPTTADFASQGFLAGVGRDSRSETQEKADVIRSLLKDFSPSEFEIKFDSTYRSDDAWTHPHRKADFSEEEWIEIKEKAEYVNFPGHFLAMKNLVAVTIATVTEEGVPENPFLQRLRYYMDQVGGSGTGRFRNRPVLSDDDTMIQMRILSCLTFAVEYHATVIERDLGMADILLEAHQFLFDDPFVNTKRMKGFLTIHRKSWFAASSSGTRVSWGSLPFGVTNRDRPTLGIPIEVPIRETDEIYLNLSFIQEALKKERAEMIELGLPHLAKFTQSLMDAEPTDMNYKRVQVINSLVAMTGFTRSVPSLAHKETIDEAAESEDVHNPPYAQHLIDSYRDFTNWWIDDRGVLTEEEFMRNVPNIVTSRSAGGRGTAKKVDVSIPLPPNLQMGFRDTLRMTLTDKRGVFMASPAYAFDVSAVKRGYTEEHPGRLGARQVTSGRGTRGIFLRDLSSFVAESDFALSLMDYMMDKGKRRLGDRARWNKFMTPIAFTIGAESGNPFADHVESFLACSDPRIVAIADDYTAYDTTQRESNMRKYLRETVAGVLEQRGFTKPFVNWEGGVAEMMRTIHGPGSVVGAFFSTKTGQWEFKLQTDQVSSGEFATLAINNMTNQAIVLQFLDEFDEAGFGADCAYTGCRIQGDDFIGFLLCPNLTTSMLEKIIKLRSDSANANGYSLNVAKSTARRFASEYLKKEVLLGRTMELRHIQWASTERDPGRVDVFGQLRSYAATMSTLAARGFSSKLALRIIMYTTALRLNIRGRVDRDIVSFYPHLACMFGPASLGGLGFYPGSLLGAAVDSPLVMYLQQHPDDLKLVNDALNPLQWKRTRRMDDLTAATLDSGVFDEGLQFMRLRQLNRKKVSAGRALSKLKSFGAPPMGDLYYPEHYKGYLKTVLSAQRSVSAHIFAMDQNDQLRNAVKRAKSRPQPSIIESSYSWIFGLEVSLEKVYIKKDKVCPSPCLDDVYRDLVREFGISQQPALSALNPQVFTSILKRGDKDAPRHLTPAEVFSYVSKPAISLSEERVANAFIAMGFEETNAVSVANQMAAFTKEYTFQNAAHTFSYGDGFLQRLDRSADLANIRVDVVGFDPDPMLNLLLQEQFLLFSILEFDRTAEDVKVSVIPKDQVGWVNVRRTFLGSTFAPLAESFLGIWDRTEQ